METPPNFLDKPRDQAAEAAAAMRLQFAESMRADLAAAAKELFASLWAQCAGTTGATT